jgi:uncharacterized membrane protein
MLGVFCNPLWSEFHMQTSIKTGMAMAAAAAALFATSLPAMAQADKMDAKVKCSGVNSCKGQNTCKGQGWNFKASAEECTKEGGKVVK